MVEMAWPAKRAIPKNVEHITAIIIIEEKGIFILLTP